MKQLGWIVLSAVSLALPARGQLFSPESVTGALLGTFIGGVAGSDCHRGFSGEGAAIGAGIGFVAGAIAGEANRRYAAARPGAAFYYAPVAHAQPGYGYVYSYAPAPAPVYVSSSRPNYAVGGTLVGALTGGLIGAANNRGWEGAGIGAASGLVVGGVAEAVAQKTERKAALAAATTVQGSPQAPPLRVQQTTARQIPPRMPPVPQIPDAPRVPDAPSF